MRDHAEDIVVPADPASVFEQLKVVLENLAGVELVAQVEDNVLEASTGTSWRSWGEVVTCTVTPTDGGTRVAVESRSEVRTTLIDWSSNRRNVESVIWQLHQTYGVQDEVD